MHTHLARPAVASAMAVFLPEVFKLHATATTTGVDAAVENLADRIDLLMKLRRQYREYYSGQVSRRLKCWPRRVVRMVS